MVGAKVGTARRLLERILNGVGHVPPDLAPPFKNEDVADPRRGLIDKVGARPAQMTDADFAEAGFVDTSSSRW
jgi:hypothetical protein